MKKIMILSSILGFFGCNPEENYLKKHDVILCYTFSNNEKLTNEALDFEKKSEIKFKDASAIYTDFLAKKNEITIEDSVKLTYPKLIIDGNYVYSFNNLKTLDIAVFGVWINSESGKITHSDTKLWLNERKISEFYKK